MYVSGEQSSAAGSHGEGPTPEGVLLTVCIYIYIYRIYIYIYISASTYIFSFFYSIYIYIFILKKEINCLHFSICACHPCAGAMLIFSVSFQF